MSMNVAAPSSQACPEKSGYAALLVEVGESLITLLEDGERSRNDFKTQARNAEILDGFGSKNHYLATNKDKITDSLVGLSDFTGPNEPTPDEGQIVNTVGVALALMGDYSLANRDTAIAFITGKLKKHTSAVGHALVETVDGDITRKNLPIAVKAVLAVFKHAAAAAE